jgi:ABC-type ATPase with predicted acetyltransferase domain
MAGLNDAYLFVRKPSEMSDGQKYRLKIAKLIESGADVWVADEFGAVLDRVTAQVVASNLQRAARKVGQPSLWRRPTRIWSMRCGRQCRSPSTSRNE